MGHQVESHHFQIIHGFRIRKVDYNIMAYGLCFVVNSRNQIPPAGASIDFQYPSFGQSIQDCDTE